MICSNCQSENREGAKFCSNCGFRLEVKCVNCGATNQPGARFCDQCGNRLLPPEHSSDGVPAPIVRSFDDGSPGDPSVLVGKHSASPSTKTLIIPGTGGSPSAGGSPSVDGKLESLIPDEYARKLETIRSQKATSSERRVVTVLFCDIKDSTAAASRLDPEEWGEIVNGAFERMVRPVYRYEGTVARLLGDAIIAFFGAPISHEDDPQRAILAGLEIVAEFGPFRGIIQARWGIDIDVRVGINTGLVMVGSMGSDYHLEYTALGDATNLAARMEQTAEPGTIQITEETYRLVAPIFDWEELGQIAVKGKEKPVKTYRPLRMRPMPGRLRGLEAYELNSLLVGRDVELSFLRQRLQELIGGRGSFITLIGEAGLGKTRLVAELHQKVVESADWIQNENLTWLEGQTTSYRQSSSYYPWRQVIRQVLGSTEADSAQEVREKIDLFYGEHKLPVEGKLFLEVLLAVESDATLRVSGNFQGESLVRQMADSVHDLLVSFSAEKPLLIVLDDLHWADDASLELLANMAPLVRTSALLFMGIMRPDKHASSWKFRQRMQDLLGSGYRELMLSPLSRDISSRLLESMLAVEQLPEKMRGSILQKAEGNPFYLEEIVRELVESGILEKEIDQEQERPVWRMAKGAFHDDSSEISIPENLQTLLISRIDRLEEEARHTLQLASVIGRTFYFRILDEVNHVVAAVHGELESQLEELQYAELILPAASRSELEYTFRHSLTQEAAYRTILRKQRREFHLRVGEVIEELYAGRLEDFYPMLAHHFTEAGDPRAAHYHLLAGDSVYRLYDLPVVIYHYSEALAPFYRSGEDIHPAEKGEVLQSLKDAHITTSELIHLFVRLGRCYELQNDYQRALGIYAQMEQLAGLIDEPEMAMTAMIQRSTVFAIPQPLQDGTRAREIIFHARELAQQLNDKPAQVRILWITMLSFNYTGFMQKGIPFGEQAIEMARILGLKEQLAQVLQDLSLPYLSMGKVKLAVENLEEARPIWEEVGNQPMLSENFVNLALAFIYLGELGKALDYCQKAGNLSQRIKNEWGMANSRLFLSNVYRAQGKIDLALDNLAITIPETRKLGHPVLTVILVFKADLYSQLGRSDLAEKTLAEAVESSFFDPFLAHALFESARFYLRAGNHDKALEVLQKAFSVEEEHGLIDTTVSQELAKVEFAVFNNELQEAGELISSLLNYVEKSEARFFLPEILLVQSKLLRLQELPQQAYSILEVAHHMAEEIGFQMILWQVLYEMAGIQEQLGNQDRTKELMDGGRSVVRAIASEISDPELKESFQTLTGIS